MKTVLECLESGSRYLKDRDIEGARRNMEWLVALQLNCSRIELYTQFDRPMSEEELAPLRDLLKRRGLGEPLQHLLGTVEFCGQEFRCDARALIPRPETEELVEQALTLPFSRPARVLDVGTGSGVLGLSLAKALATDCQEVVLVDISQEALALGGENAEKLELRATIMESDLLSATEGPFDLIAANLPYVAESEREALSHEVRHDPATALFGGPDGLDVIRRFLPQVPAQLAPGGCLAMEIGATQGPEVAELTRQIGLNEVRVVNDLSGNPRFVFAQAAGHSETSSATS